MNQMMSIGVCCKQIFFFFCWLAADINASAFTAATDQTLTKSH